MRQSRPPWLAPLLLVSVLLWALTACAVMTRPAQPAPPFPVRPERAGASGVNLSRAEFASPSPEALLDSLDQSGIHWIRFTLPWSEIETAQGSFDWTVWDGAFRALAAHPALIPVVVLDTTPAWARSAVDAANPAAPPRERSDFGAFARAVANRYGDTVDYYQVWHEPNIAPHWGAGPVDPLGYAGLLREGAIQLRATDATATILLAALAPTTEPGGANMDDIAYLEALYDAGADSWFDVAAAQPYGFSAPPDAGARRNDLNFARVSLWREVMVGRGDASTPIFATAFGWNAGQNTPWGGVSGPEQAEYTGKALRIAHEQWPWLGPLFWAAACPMRAAGDPWNGFSLCDGDGRLTSPTFAVLSSQPELGAVLSEGTYATDHPALTYSGGWRVTAHGADPGRDGATLEFRFRGEGLALQVERGSYWAYLTATVDGVPANALPKDESGAAILVLNDPLGATVTLPIATRLAEGEHTVRLVSTGGWGQWPLRSVVITGHRPGARLPIAPLALLALIAMSAAALVAWPLRARAAGRALRTLDLPTRVPDPVAWGVALLLGLALAFSRWGLLDVALLAALGLVFLTRPELSLPLIGASIPFWQQPKQLLSWEFSLLEIFISLGAAALAARLLIEGASNAGRTVPEGRPSLSWTVADAPVVLLLAAGVVATLGAAERGAALRELRIVFIDGALLYWLVARLVPLGPRRVTWPLVHGVLAGMALASGIGLWQLGTGQGRIDVEGVWRVRALYGSPNNLALVLVRAVPLAISLAAFGAYKLRRRAVYGAAAVLFLAACIATFSKGALLLGLPAGLAVVLAGGARKSRRAWPLILLGVVVVVGLAGAVLLFRTPRFADLFNFEAGTSFLRLRLWQGAWNMGLDHPIAGVGPDNFLYAYRTRYVLPSAWEELNLSHPHNLILDLFTRLGLIGLVAGGYALTAAFRRAWIAFRRGDSGTWPLALGLLGGLAATVLHGLIDNSLFLPDLMALFILALALLRPWARPATSDPQAEVST